ncbi:hypothetical protein C8R46DRAFT_1230946 [Mycena filopes]|nr:hypothetical protein C8R46DRAFT_1230946 [Mycena filopes]
MVENPLGAWSRYRGLLEDGENEDPSKRGCLLVSGVSGWQTQMAKWVAESKEAEAAERREVAEKAARKALRQTLSESNSDADSESDEDDEDAPRLPKKPTWTPITLALLFGEAEKPRKRKPLARVLAGSTIDGDLS